MAVVSAFHSQVSISPGSMQESNLRRGGGGACPRSALRGWTSSSSSKYDSVSVRSQGLGDKQDMARSSRGPGCASLQMVGPSLSEMGWAQPASFFCCVSSSCCFYLSLCLSLSVTLCLSYSVSVFCALCISFLPHSCLSYFSSFLSLSPCLHFDLF